MNVAELSVEKIKALVYDHIANINASQQSIKYLEAELAKRKSQPSTNGTEAQAETQAQA